MNFEAVNVAVSVLGFLFVLLGALYGHLTRGSRKNAADLEALGESFADYCQAAATERSERDEAFASYREKVLRERTAREDQRLSDQSRRDDELNKRLREMEHDVRDRVGEATRGLVKRKEVEQIYSKINSTIASNHDLARDLAKATGAIQGIDRQLGALVGTLVQKGLEDR